MEEHTDREARQFCNDEGGARSTWALSLERTSCRRKQVLTLGKQTIHHSLNEFKLVLKGVVDEICIYEHAVRGSEGRVVGKEEGGGGLGTGVE